MALSTSKLLKISYGEGTLPALNLTDNATYIPTAAPSLYYYEDGSQLQAASSSGAGAGPDGTCAENTKVDCNQKLLNKDEYLEFLVCSIGDLVGKSEHVIAVRSKKNGLIGVT